MKKSIDFSKTLDELEGFDSGEPDYPSSLVIRCTELCKIPLKDFTPGDLRVMLGQQFSPQYLLTLALPLLHKNPLICGEYYDGDILTNVLTLPKEFWVKNPDLKLEIDDIIKDATEKLNGLSEDELVCFDVPMRAIQQFSD